MYNSMVFKCKNYCARVARIIVVPTRKYFLRVVDAVFEQHVQCRTFRALPHDPKKDRVISLFSSFLFASTTVTGFCDIFCISLPLSPNAVWTCHPFLIILLPTSRVVRNVTNIRVFREGFKCEGWAIGWLRVRVLEVIYVMVRVLQV